MGGWSSTSCPIKNRPLFDNIRDSLPENPERKPVNHSRAELTLPPAPHWHYPGLTGYGGIYSYGSPGIAHASYAWIISPHVKHDSHRQLSNTTTVAVHIFPRGQISISFEGQVGWYVIQAVQHLHSPALHPHESPQLQELTPQAPARSMGFWMTGDIVVWIRYGYSGFRCASSRYTLSPYNGPTSAFIYCRAMDQSITHPSP